MAVAFSAAGSLPTDDRRTSPASADGPGATPDSEASLELSGGIVRLGSAKRLEAGRIEAMTLREELERVRSMPLPSNEEMAKIQIVLPVLDALGWDTRDPTEVVYEYQVGAGGRGSRGGGGKADIALFSRPDRPVVIIEAKTPGQEFNSRHVEQVLGYAYYEGVTICVLTNGSDWWLYLPREGGQPVERRFAELKLREDPLDELERQLRAFLGRRALLGDGAEKQARKALEQRIHFGQIQRELPRIWSQMIGEPGGDAPDPDLLRLVRRRFVAKVGLKPTDDQIAAVIRGRPIPPSATGNGPPSGSAGAAKVVKPRKPQGSGGAQAAALPTGVELWGRQHPVRSFNDIPVGVALALHDRHRSDFHRIGELQGKKHRYASRNRSELRQAKAVGSTGWYIDVSLSAPNTVKRAELFLRHFGYDPAELKLLYQSEGDTSSAIKDDMTGRADSARGESPQAVPLRQDESRMTATPSRRTPRPSRKPTGFELWGETYPVKRFTDISIGVAKALHDRHRHDFHRIAELRGKTRLYASRNPSELFRPKQVGETGWHIDVNLSGHTHVERARQFLEHFGHDPDNLTILYD